MIPTPDRRKGINLYQAEFRPARQTLSGRLLLAGSAVYFCLFLLLAAWDAWGLFLDRQAVDEAQTQARKIETRLAELQGVTTAAATALAAEAAALEEKGRALQQLHRLLQTGELGSPEGYSGHFVALSQAAVPGIWLTRIEIEAGGRQMGLEGRALRGEQVSRFIAMLGRQPALARMDFALLKLRPPEATEDAAQRPSYLEFTLSSRPPEQTQKPNS